MFRNTSQRAGHRDCLAINVASKPLCLICHEGAQIGCFRTIDNSLALICLSCMMRGYCLPLTTIQEEVQIASAIAQALNLYEALPPSSLKS